MGFLSRIASARSRTILAIRIATNPNSRIVWIGHITPLISFNRTSTKVFTHYLYIVSCLPLWLFALERSVMSYDIYANVSGHGLFLKTQVLICSDFDYITPAFDTLSHRRTLITRFSYTLQSCFLFLSKPP